MLRLSFGTGRVAHKLGRAMLANGTLVPPVASPCMKDLVTEDQRHYRDKTQKNVIECDILRN
jgi:hypothetical protein